MMAEFSIDNGSHSSANPDYAEIVVVRCGQTTWHATGRIQGHLGVELNETGRQQAIAVADRLSRESKPSAIYSSDLQRAFETAQIIASRCGELEVVKDTDLRERHLGELQGHFFHEIAKTNPIARKAFMSKNRDQEIPGGGESLAQLFDRSKSAMLRIGMKHKGERIIVVSHEAFIKELSKWDSPKGWIGKVLNGCVSVFYLYDEDNWSSEVCHGRSDFCWADVSHLSQTRLPQSRVGGDRNLGKTRFPASASGGDRNFGPDIGFMSHLD